MKTITWLKNEIQEIRYIKFCLYEGGIRQAKRRRTGRPGFGFGKK